MIKFSRHWSMASADTFDCEPIKGFVQKYLLASKVSVDPFARNKRWATFTNDLNPQTAAQCHLDANEFLKKLVQEKVIADLVIFDPPYSRRQIMECYEGIGQKFLQKDSQYHSLNWKNEREQIDKLLIGGGICLSFGWHTNGMQQSGEYEIIEIMTVAHGGAHNDTICMAERKIISAQNELFNA